MNRAAFAVLVIWAVLAPLLLGSVPEAEIADQSDFGSFLAAGGAYAVFKVLGFLALGLALADFLSRPGSRPAPDRGGRILLLLLAAIPVLGLFQLVPLPRFIHVILAPAHAGDLDLLLPGWSMSSISIDPEVVDPDDVEMLQDLIMAAVNDALNKAKAMMNEEMGQLTKGMNIPGMPGLM